jgi:hypothetical protein
VVAEGLEPATGPTRFSSLVAAPAMRVLSGIDGQAPCYPAFPLVVLLRKSYKDEVNSLPGLDDDRAAMDG